MIMHYAIRVGLLALTLVPGAAAAADKARFSGADIFDLAYASDPLVAADGEQIFYLRNTMDPLADKRRRNLWMVAADGSGHRPLTTGPGNISSPALAPGGDRIAYVDSDDSGAQLFVEWVDGGERAQLTRVAHRPRRLSWSPDGRWLAFTMLVPYQPPTFGELPPKPEGAEWAPPPVVVERAVFRNDGRGMRAYGYQHVFVIPASGGSPRQVTSGDFDHEGGIAWTADSEALIVSANRGADWETNPVNTDLFRVPRDGGEPLQLTDRQGPDRSPRVSPDGRHIAWLGWDDEGLGYHRSRLYLMSLDGGDRRELLPELDRDVQNPRWARDSKRIFFSFDDEGDTVLASTGLTGGLERHASGLGGTSLGRPYAGSDFAVGGADVFAFTAGDTTRPADIASGRRGAERIERLTALNRNLLPHRALAPVEERWVESSADGRAIQAWVALPPDFDPERRYPMILEIHGGPFANYGERFSAEVQLYAAAGYVVVYANPRGSTSYGEEFGNLIHHAYPGEDYDDLMSVVDAVVAEGYVDPAELYVTGGSGGGVLSAWIVGKTDRFRAAVVAKPVINWASFVLIADNAPYFSRYWFPAMPWEDPEGYWARSPLSLVGNVSTPTMLLTGEDDLRTPISESEQFYQALKLRGVDTALVRMPGAYHGIAKRPSQLAGKAAAVLAWFERYSPDGS